MARSKKKIAAASADASKTTKRSSSREIGTEVLETLAEGEEEATKKEEEIVDVSSKEQDEEEDLKPFWWIVDAETDEKLRKIKVGEKQTLGRDYVQMELAPLRIDNKKVSRTQAEIVAHMDHVKLTCKKPSTMRYVTNRKKPADFVRVTQDETIEWNSEGYLEPAFKAPGKNRLCIEFHQLNPKEPEIPFTHWVVYDPCTNGDLRELTFDEEVILGRDRTNIEGPKLNITSLKVSRKQVNAKVSKDHVECQNIGRNHIRYVTDVLAGSDERKVGKEQTFLWDSKGLLELLYEKRGENMIRLRKNTEEANALNPSPSLMMKRKEGTATKSPPAKKSNDDAGKSLGSAVSTNAAKRRLPQRKLREQLKRQRTMDSGTNTLESDVSPQKSSRMVFNWSKAEAGGGPEDGSRDDINEGLDLMGGFSPSADFDDVTRQNNLRTAEAYPFNLKRQVSATSIMSSDKHGHSPRLISNKPRRSSHISNASSLGEESFSRAQILGGKRRRVRDEDGEGGEISPVDSEREVQGPRLGPEYQVEIPAMLAKPKDLRKAGKGRGSISEWAKMLQNEPETLPKDADEQFDTTHNWSPTEERVFHNAMLDYNKDFRAVWRKVPVFREFKSPSDLVSYYYKRYKGTREYLLWKMSDSSPPYATFDGRSLEEYPPDFSSDSTKASGISAPTLHAMVELGFVLPGYNCIRFKMEGKDVVFANLNLDGTITYKKKRFEKVKDFVAQFASHEELRERDPWDLLVFEFPENKVTELSKLRDLYVFRCSERQKELAEATSAQNNGHALNTSDNNNIAPVEDLGIPRINTSPRPARGIRSLGSKETNGSNTTTTNNNMDSYVTRAGRRASAYQQTNDSYMPGSVRSKLNAPSSLPDSFRTAVFTTRLAGPGAANIGQVSKSGGRFDAPKQQGFYTLDFESESDTDEEVDAGTPVGKSAMTSSGKSFLAEISLKTLIDEGLIKPGKKVLRVKYKQRSFWADLRKDGIIVECDTGKRYQHPSLWSIQVKRSVNPGVRSDSGWYSIIYIPKKISASEEEEKSEGNDEKSSRKGDEGESFRGDANEMDVDEEGEDGNDDDNDEYADGEEEDENDVDADGSHQLHTYRKLLLARRFAANEQSKKHSFSILSRLRQLRRKVKDPELKNLFEQEEPFLREHHYANAELLQWRQETQEVDGGDGIVNAPEEIGIDELENFSFPSFAGRGRKKRRFAISVSVHHTKRPRKAHKLYCICQKRSHAAEDKEPMDDDLPRDEVCNEREGAFLLQCSKASGACNGWIHPRCFDLKISENDGAKLREFICPLCSADGVEIRKSKSSNLSNPSVSAQSKFKSVTYPIGTIIMSRIEYPEGNPVGWFPARISEYDPLVHPETPYKITYAFNPLFCEWITLRPNDPSRMLAEDWCVSFCYSAQDQRWREGTKVAARKLRKKK